MKSSFAIWLSRDITAWDSSKIEVSSSNVKLTFPLTSDCPSGSSPTRVAGNQHPQKNNKNIPSNVSSAKRPPGFINKGNTCYANSILQALCAIPSLWTHAPAKSGQLSQITRSICTLMSWRTRKPEPLDPSNFFRALQSTFRKNGSDHFNCNLQHDIPEVLSVVLDELKSASVHHSGFLSTSLKHTFTCDECFTKSSNEESLDILPVP